MTYVVERAPSGWKASHDAAAGDPEERGFEPLSESETVKVDADYRKQAWVRRFAKGDIANLRLCAKHKT